jgi:hypothetical protein
MVTMITCLENGRDWIDSARSKQFHRIIKRMRKAGYGLRDVS